MKTCSLCHNQVADNASYCPICGKRFVVPTSWIAVGFVIVLALVITTIFLGNYMARLGSYWDSIR